MFYQICELTTYYKHKAIEKVYNNLKQVHANINQNYRDFQAEQTTVKSVPFYCYYKL